jgi:hypothetical protein
MDVSCEFSEWANADSRKGMILQPEVGQGANIDRKQTSMLEMLHQGTSCRQNIFDSVSNELGID